MIKPGDLIRDKVTGFKGIAIATTKWLNGCIRVGIQPRDLDKDGKMIEEKWFDIDQLEFIEHTNLASPRADEDTAKLDYPAVAVVEKKRATGGPQDDPTRVSGQESG